MQMECVILLCYVGGAFVCAFYLPMLGSRLLIYRKIDHSFVNRPSLVLAIIAGFVSIATFFHIDNNSDRFISLLFLLLLLLIAWIDLHTGYILNELTFGGMIIFFCYQGIEHGSQLPIYLLSSFVTGILLTLLAKFSKGIGLGDAKLMAMCALVISWSSIIIAFWIASVSGLIYILYLRKKVTIHRKYAIAFGPHLAFGAYFSFLYGRELIEHFSKYVVLSTLVAHIL